MYKPTEKSFFSSSSSPPSHGQVTFKSPGRGGRGEVAGAQIGEEHPGRGRGRTDHGKWWDDGQCHFPANLAKMMGKLGLKKKTKLLIMTHRNKV